MNNLRDDYDENKLPSHPCLKLVGNCEQTLSKATSRRLLTFEKIKEPNKMDLLQNVDIMDFREKYFELREETRKERRMRDAKVRDENRIKHTKEK